MRWWAAILVLVIAAALVVSIVRGRPDTVGAKVLKALETQKGPQRVAIPILDDFPGQAADAPAFSTGDGTPPGEGLDVVYRQHWVRGPKVEFVWQDHPGATAPGLPLRAALADASPPRQEMARAMAAAGYFSGAIDPALAKAGRDLAHMTDEELLLAWLKADRGVMAESDDLARCCREGMLLLARQNPGPAIVFQVGAGRVYLFPLDGPQAPAGSVVWTQLEAFEKGQEIWSGVLRMEGSPDPARVRQIAALVAQQPGKPPLPK